MVRPLDEVFPGLAAGGYRVTSPRDRDYNCIAWAAGETHAWWWPGQDVSKEYWPPGVPREQTRDAFVAAFATLGYAVCEGEAPEAGYEKIALFADAAGRPTHAPGNWPAAVGPASSARPKISNTSCTIWRGPFT